MMLRPTASVRFRPADVGTSSRRFWSDAIKRLVSLPDPRPTAVPDRQNRQPDGYTPVDVRPKMRRQKEKLRSAVSTARLEQSALVLDDRSSNGLPGSVPERDQDDAVEPWYELFLNFCNCTERLLASVECHRVSLGVTVNVLIGSTPTVVAMDAICCQLSVGPRAKLVHFGSDQSVSNTSIEASARYF